MEYALYFLLFGVIPFCAFFFTRHAILGFAIACLLGCPIFAGRMIYLEAHAVDSDIDFVFIVGVAIWCFMLSLIYCGCAISVGIFRRMKVKSIAS